MRCSANTCKKMQLSPQPSYQAKDEEIVKPTFLQSFRLRGYVPLEPREINSQVKGNGKVKGVNFLTPTGGGLYKARTVLHLLISEISGDRHL